MITFTVRGLPAPQGSKRAIVNRYTRRAALVESSARVKPWRADVRGDAEDAMTTPDGLTIAPFAGPVAVELAFRMPRPKGHHGSGRNAGAIKASAPIWPAGKPDLDKLARAVLDAITSIVIVDDSQVVDLGVRKRYADGEPPGVTVTVRDLTQRNDALPFEVAELASRPVGVPRHQLLEQLELTHQED